MNENKGEEETWEGTNPREDGADLVICRRGNHWENHRGEVKREVKVRGSMVPVEGQWGFTEKIVR